MLTIERIDVANAGPAARLVAGAMATHATGRGVVASGDAATTLVGSVVDGGTDGAGWVVVGPDGGARAALCAHFAGSDTCTPTCTPPCHVRVPLFGWVTSTPADADLLAPLLFRELREEAVVRGIGRVLVDLFAGDWANAAPLLALGLRPGAVLAARAVPCPPTPADRAVTRPMAPEDRASLIDLTAEEVTGREREAAARLVDRWCDDGATVVVADGDDGRPAAVLALRCVALPPGTSARAYAPERYGYVSALVVGAPARGRGLGTALVGAAMREFAARSIEVAMLHYLHDDLATRPFWTRQGFAPVLTGLTGPL